MQFSYDKVANAMYIKFSNEKVRVTEEISEGIIIDYGLGDDVIGIEVLNYSKRKLDLNEIVKLDSDEIIPVVIQC